MKLKFKSVALMILAVPLIGAAISFGEETSKFEQSVESVIEATHKAEEIEKKNYSLSYFNENIYNTYEVISTETPHSKYKGDEKEVDGHIEHRYLGRHFYNRDLKLTNPNYPDDEKPSKPLHTWKWIENDESNKRNNINNYFRDDASQKRLYEAAIMIALEERFDDLFDPTAKENSIEAYFKRAIVLQPMTDYSRGYIQLRHIKEDGTEWYVTLVTPVGSDPLITGYPLENNFPTPNPDGDGHAHQPVDTDDLSVTDLKSLRYPANNNVKAYVTVENSFDKEVTSTLDFSVSGLIETSKTLTLAPNEITLVEFDFQTGNAGTETMSAEINKDKSVIEIRYDNNRYDQEIEIYGTGYTGGGCSSGSNKVRWTETDSRMEKRTKTYYNKKGEKKKRTYRVKVYYDFKYEASIDLSVNAYDDSGKNASKGKNVGNSFTTKSGYGFFLEPVASVSYKQISGKWSREPNNKPSAPHKCVLKLPYKIPNKDYRGKKQTPQASKINFNKISSSSYSTSFNLPSNPISQYGYKKAYTFIDLEDGAYNYYVTVYADAPYRDICKTFTGTIKIKGTMHEDYRIY